MTAQALLVLDAQIRAMEFVPDAADELVPALRTAVDAARANGVHVIYVTLAFRRGGPEVSAGNRAFARHANSGAAGVGHDDPGTAVHPAIAPQDGDVVVVKKRICGFTGSDLDVVLRSLDVREIVLAGVATSGAVASTLLHAADLDFGITVLADGCADPDGELHHCLMARVFPRHAEVVHVAEWVNGLDSGRSVSGRRQDTSS